MVLMMAASILLINMKSLLKQEPGGYSTFSLNNDWFIAKNNQTQNKLESIARWELVKSSDGLTFVYAGDDVSSPTRTVHVKDDMSLELRVAGRLATFPVYDKAKCFDDVCEVLRQVPYLSVCMGSDGKGNCPEVYFIRKPHSGSERCKICQLEHKRNHDRIKHREKRLQKKLQTNTKIKKRMKETIRHRDAQISSLKIEIDGLIEKCNNLSDVKTS